MRHFLVEFLIGFVSGVAFGWFIFALLTIGKNR